MKMIYLYCFLGVGVWENSKKNVVLWAVAEKMDMCSYLCVGKINISQDVSYSLDNFKCLYSTWYQILLELRKEGEWLCHVQCDSVTWGMCTGLSGILNHNEQWTAIFRAFIFTVLHTQWHTVLHTQWRTHWCHRSRNSLSHTSLHSHYSNTVDLSTVVMLGFWLCQFNTGSLAFWLCLSSTTECFVWLFQFNVCRLWWCLCFEFLQVCLCLFKICKLG
jgi:hypothetical protein